MKRCNISIVLFFVFLLKFTGTNGHIKPLYQGKKLPWKHTLQTNVASNQYMDSQSLSQSQSLSTYKFMMFLTKTNPKLLNYMPPKMVNDVLNTLSQKPSLLNQLPSDDILALLSAISTSPNLKKSIPTKLLQPMSGNGQMVNFNSQVQSQQSPYDFSSSIMTDVDQDTNKSFNLESSIGASFESNVNSNSGLSAAANAGTKIGINAGSNVEVGAAISGGANFGIENKVQTEAILGATAVHSTASQPSVPALVFPFVCTPDVVVPSVFPAGISLPDILRILHCAHVNSEKKPKKPIIPITIDVGTRICCIASPHGPCDTITTITPSTTGTYSTPITTTSSPYPPTVTTTEISTVTPTSTVTILPSTTTIGTSTTAIGSSSTTVSALPPTMPTIDLSTTPSLPVPTTPDRWSTTTTSTQPPCFETTHPPIYPALPKSKDFIISPALLTKLLYKFGIIAEKLQDGYKKISQKKLPTIVHLPVYKHTLELDHMKHFPKSTLLKKKPSHGEVPYMYK